VSGRGIGDPRAPIDAVLDLLNHLYPAPIQLPAAASLPGWRLNPARAPDEVPADLMARITSLSVHDASDRSAACHGVVGELLYLNFDVANICALLEKYPHGVAQKFINDNRLQREVERSFWKICGEFEAQKRDSPLAHTVVSPPLSIWNRPRRRPVLANEAVLARAIAEQVAPARAGNPQLSKFIFEDDASATPSRMLVKKLLPASGIAFIGGQPSAGKTFIAVALGVSLASGKEFFKRSVKERIGVLYIAAEGFASFKFRVMAAKIAADVTGSIPFAWTGAPALTTQQEISTFIRNLQNLGQEMQRRYDVRLGAVFIDTVAACFPMKDENSNAEVSRVCAVMRQIGIATDTVVVPIHHYGKDATAGLRGASAWQADMVISVTADIEPTGGAVSNRGLAVAKARDAEQGPVAPFKLDHIKLGIDDDGDEFGSCVVRDDPDRQVVKTERRAAAFGAAVGVALANAVDVQLIGGATVRAVELEQVKVAFAARYVTMLRRRPSPLASKRRQSCARLPGVAACRWIGSRHRSLTSARTACSIFSKRTSP
jgi:hypothetical protein